jgi:hypothetical protein
MEHTNLGETARFWLRRHDMFREICGALQSAVSDFKEELVSPREFRNWFAPRLQFFLSELHVHHQIEDLSYFPLFRAAEPRLLRGFDVLESDHEHIHEWIAAVADAANAVLRDLDKNDLRPPSMPTAPSAIGSSTDWSATSEMKRISSFR